MSGYVVRLSGQTSDEFPYARLIVSLASGARSMLDRAGLSDSFREYRFGKEIQGLAKGGTLKAAELCVGASCNKFYHDRPFNAESHIEDVLDRIGSEDPGHLAIVLTDLFLRREDVRGDSSAAISPLSRALDQDRAVGILGVRSGFNGPVYDLPGVQGAYPLQGSRPVFALLLGPAASVRSLMLEVEEQFSRMARPPEHHGLVFARDVLGKVRTMETLGRAAVKTSRGVRRPGRAIVSSLPLPQQFVLQSSHGGIELDLELESGQPAFSPPMGELTARTRQWVRYPADEACEFSSWEEANPVRSPVSFGENGRSIRLFDPENQREPALANALYVTEVRIDATRLRAQPERNRWFYDWSFDAEETSDLLAENPSFFKTLNLRRFYDVLQEITSDAIRDRPVANLVLAVHVEE